jgi:hypothetical protein
MKNGGSEGVGMAFGGEEVSLTVELRRGGMVEIRGCGVAGMKMVTGQGGIGRKACACERKLVGGTLERRAIFGWRRLVEGSELSKGELVSV